MRNGAKGLPRQCTELRSININLICVYCLTPQPRLCRLCRLQCLQIHNEAPYHCLPCTFGSVARSTSTSTCCCTSRYLTPSTSFLLRRRSFAFGVLASIALLCWSHACCDLATFCTCSLRISIGFTPAAVQQERESRHIGKHRRPTCVSVSFLNTT